jgi:hypothetical protein
MGRDGASSREACHSAGLYLHRSIEGNLHLFFMLRVVHTRRMSNLMRAVRAVLWSFIGLGGRRADADQRTAQVGILPLIGVALVVVALLVAGLITLAHFAAGT